MENANLLIVAMAEQCRSLILHWDQPDLTLPRPVQPKHLLWMCDQIEENVECGPATKLHRWIGFIQGAMLAHRMLDLDGVKAMFDKAEVAHGDNDEDLLDHLDAASSFEVDIGGQG